MKIEDVFDAGSAEVLLSQMNIEWTRKEEFIIEVSYWNEDKCVAVWFEFEHQLVIEE